MTINGEPVDIEKNENSHYRGMHVVIINPTDGEVEFAKVFDTYENSETF